MVINARRNSTTQPTIRPNITQQAQVGTTSTARREYAGPADANQIQAVQSTVADDVFAPEEEGKQLFMGASETGSQLGATDYTNISELYGDQGTEAEKPDISNVTPKVTEKTNTEQQGGTSTTEEPVKQSRKQNNKLENENYWTEEELTQQVLPQYYRQSPDVDPRSSYQFWDQWLKQYGNRINPKHAPNYGPENLARKEMMSHWNMANPGKNWKMEGMEGRARAWQKGNARHPLEDQFGDQFDSEWEKVRAYWANRDAQKGQAFEKPPRPEELEQNIFRTADGKPLSMEDMVEADKVDLADLEEQAEYPGSNIDILTNDAATAINKDTGEVLEGQHVPERASSAYLDEVPNKEKMTDIELSKWLDEHRLERDRTGIKIEQKIKHLDKDYYDAVEFQQTHQYLEPEMEERLRNKQLEHDRKISEAIIRDHELGFMHVEGEHINRNKEGNKYYVEDDLEVEAARSQFARALGLDKMQDRQTIDKMVRKALGFTRDTEGKLFDGKVDPNKPLYKNTYMDALDYMRRSLETTGDLFAFTEDYKAGVRGFKDLRFPVGVYSQEEAEIVANVLNITPEQVIERGRLNTIDTYQIVVQYAYANGDIQMLKAWENHVRALCKLEGYKASAYGVPDMGTGSFGEEVLANEMFKDIMGDGYPDAIEAADERTAKAREHIQKQGERRGARIEEDDKGNKKVVLGKVDSWSNSLVSIASMIHIVGDLRLIITGAAEYTGGNIASRIAAKAMIGYDTRWTPSDFLLDMSKTVQQKERVAAVQMLFRAGSGFDFVQAFAATGKAWTLQNAQQFILQESPSTSSEKLKKAQSWVADNVDKIQSGAFMNGMDSTTFMWSLMSEMAFTKGYTTEQIEEGFRRNPDAFMSFLMQRGEGKQALVQMTNLYAARISPASEAVSNFLRSHGMTNAAASVILGSPFITYGVRAFELFTPFSNTISWYLTSKSKHADKETQLGGIDEDGWKKALLFDSIKLGSEALVCCVFAGAIAICGGIEPPDDPEKYYLPWEWKIKVPWSDEAIPFHQSWFMDDLLTWTAPLAMSLCFASQTGDFSGAAKMFMNGFRDIYDTNKVVKAVRGLTELPGLLMNIGQLDPSDWACKKLVGIVDYVTKPMGLYQAQDWLLGNELDRNSSYRLVDGKEVYREDYFERMWAQRASDNELMAFLGNAWQAAHGNGWNVFGRDNDGYSHDPDERLAQMCQTWSYQQYLKDHPGMGDSEGAKASYAEWICNRLDEYNNEVDAAEHGFAISASDAYTVRDYLYGKLDDANDQLIDLKKAHANGSFYGRSDQYWSLKDGYDTEISGYYDLLETLAYKGVIYSDDVYNIERGSTLTMYGVKDENGNDKRYNYGDRQTWLSPFTSPETGNDYFREVSATPSGTEGNYGDFRTESYRNDDTTAYARHDVPNELNGIVKEFQDGYKAKKEELKAKETEALASAAKTGGSYSGGGGGYSSSYRSYSYSGGGSSYEYNPKIYAIHGNSLNPNKPAQMYSKNPYSTKTTYLSPQVTTKGSHGAYRRNEM